MTLVFLNMAADLSSLDRCTVASYSNLACAFAFSISARMVSSATICLIVLVLIFNFLSFRNIFIINWNFNL